MHSYMIAINQVQKFNPIIPFSFIPLSSSSFHLHFILFFSPFSLSFPFHLFSLILSLIYFLPLPSSSFPFLIFVFSLISPFFLISLSFSLSSPFSFSPPFLSLSPPPSSLLFSPPPSSFLFSPPPSSLLFSPPPPPSSLLFSPRSLFPSLISVLFHGFPEMWPDIQRLKTLALKSTCLNLETSGL